MELFVEGLLLTECWLLCVNGVLIADWSLFDIVVCMLSYVALWMWPVVRNPVSVAVCSLSLVACCVLCVICCLFGVVCCAFCDVCCWLLCIVCLLFVGWWLSFAVYRMLYYVGCVMLVARCLLFDVWKLLCGVLIRGC